MITLNDLRYMITLIEQCDQTLDGKRPPEWLARKIKQAERDAVLKQRDVLVQRVKAAGVPLVEDQA